MNYKFNIHGISCKSCIEKISSLLTNKVNATNIKFSANNTIIEFGYFGPSPQNCKILRSNPTRSQYYQCS